MHIYHLIALFTYLFVLFRIILITICYLFISGSLFRLYLFRLPYLAITYL